MIDITDEMIRKIRDRIGGSEIAARSAAEAVLAIVERDRAEEAAAVQAVVDAYRASCAKGYFRYPRGPVAWAVDRLSKVVGG